MNVIRVGWWQVKTLVNILLLDKYEYQIIKTVWNVLKEREGFPLFIYYQIICISQNSWTWGAIGAKVAIYCDKQVMVYLFLKLSTIAWNIQIQLFKDRLLKQQQRHIFTCHIIKAGRGCNSTITFYSRANAFRTNIHQLPYKSRCSDNLFCKSTLNSKQN